jgi:hypothetical protein
MRPIEMSDILTHFQSEEVSFARCFERQFQAAFAVTPPASFTPDDLMKWWAGYQELLRCHQNFISLSTNQIANRIQEMNNENAEIFSGIERELASFPLGMSSRNRLTLCSRC